MVPTSTLFFVLLAAPSKNGLLTTCTYKNYNCNKEIIYIRLQCKVLLSQCEVSLI